MMVNFDLTNLTFDKLNNTNFSVFTNKLQS